MRTDTSLDSSFRKSNDWEFELNDFDLSMVTSIPTAAGDVPSTKKVTNSFSGHERNHLFLNLAAKRFVDESALSGLDLSGDSRSFGFLDYDRDGWTDIALINANEPSFTLFHNEIGLASGRARPNFIAVRFVGGSTTAAPSDYASRDGIGAKVRVVAGDLTLMRELRCGDGFASQSSNTLMVGIAERDEAETVVVEWPSGESASRANVPSQSLVTIYEVASQSPTGESFVVDPYPFLERATSSQVASRSGDSLDVEVQEEKAPKLRAFVTMATWCVACKQLAPQVESVAEAFDAAEVALYGLPIDPSDDAAKLEAYVEVNHPAYRLLVDLPIDGREGAQRVVVLGTGTDALPSTIVTDAQGRVVEVFSGVPSVSDLGRLLNELDAD